MSTPGKLLDLMSGAAKIRFATDAAWAKAARLPKETLSRLKIQNSCDLRTLAALAETAGFELAVVPRRQTVHGDHMPSHFNRDDEQRVLDLVVSGVTEPDVWQSYGPAFFMAGVAVMLASVPGFARERYLALAEKLHPGASTPEVFSLWLRRSPLRPARFLPMVSHSGR